MKRRIISIIAAFLMGLCLTVPVLAGPVTSYGGKSLTQWQTIYWKWTYGAINVPLDANGNAVVGKVVLMPIPADPSDGSRGIQNVKLNNGQAFVLPFWTLIGQTYQDGSVDNFKDYVNIFPHLDLTVKIDGKKVITSKNLMKFYSANFFNPPIKYFDPVTGAIAQNWFQDIGMISTPLSIGRHIIELDGVNTTMTDYFIFKHCNTWHINVVPEPATMLLLGLGLIGLAGFRRKFSN